MAAATVRAHLRGLEVLQALNRHNYATALQLSRATRLPRPTVYRLLATLIEAGFVEQPNEGEQYCLRSSVLSLSRGFDDRAATLEAARPLVDAFSAETGWPAYVHVYEAGAMVPLHVVRSPRELSYPRLGSPVPVVETSPGRAFLASADDAERSAFLDGLTSDTAEPGRKIADLRRVRRLMQEAASYGCGFRDQGWLPRTCSLSVPIRLGGRPVAFVTVVVMRAVMSLGQSIDAYLPAVQATADRIEHAIARR